MTYSLNGKVMGNAIYQLSADGGTLTTRQKTGEGSTTIYRRRSAERQELAGAWGIKSGQVSTFTIEVAEGYDLVFSSGAAKCKANFAGRDYPIVVGEKPSAVEMCRISLTQMSGPEGQPPAYTIVHDRQ